MIIGDIKTDGTFVNNEDETIVMYYTVDKENIKSFLPDTEMDEDIISMEICIQIPVREMIVLNAKYDKNHFNIDMDIHKNHVYVEASPTKEVDDEITDYDWKEINLSPEEIISLLTTR